MSDAPAPKHLQDISALESDLASAAKARDQVRLTVLRLLKAALLNYRIEIKEDLTPQQIMAVLQKEAKKRQDSIEQYKNAGRNDLVEEEKAELAVIDEYLPEKMSQAELEKIVDEAINETNATGMSDMGKVMGVVSKQTAGQADGATLSSIVKARLSQ